MRRVVFLTPDLRAGGAERVALLYASHLDRERFAPSLLLLEAAGPLRAMAPEGLPVHALGARPLRARAAAFPLWRWLRRERPDVVVASLAHLACLLLALKPALPSSTRLWVREANLPSASLSPWLRRLAGRLYPLADGVICPSLAIGEELARWGVAMDRLHHLPNPVDVAALHAQAEQARRDMDETVPAPEILAVGRLHPRKGFDILLEALALLPERRCLVLGGGREGAHGRELQAMAARLGLAERVCFAGEVANPWGWMARVAETGGVLAMPSRFEGLPNAALEAQALGLPVVASRVPGMGEAVPEGVGGLLTPPDDAESLAHALETGLSRRWDRQGMMDRVRRRHDAPGAARRLEQALDQALDQALNQALDRRAW